jgi:hypothetical protein
MSETETRKGLRLIFSAVGERYPERKYKNYRHDKK